MKWPDAEQGASADEFLDRVPAEARALVVRLLAEPPLPAEQLRAAVGEHLERCRAERADNGLVDIAQAEDLAQRCLTLLVALPPSADPTLRTVVQATVRYFVIEEDGSGDMDVGGLDDDQDVVEVAEEVLRDAGLLRL